MSGGGSWRVESAAPGILWPGLPQGGGALVLSVLHQLEGTQWLAPERLLERQLEQLAVLLRHAFITTPYYKSRWAGRYDPTAPLTSDRFARLPLLARRDLQDRFAGLRSANPPAAHGAPEERRTSGSSGAPVRFLTAPITGVFWNAFTLRDHRWHRRDLGLKLAVIRREVEDSDVGNWGPATAGLLTTGRSVGRSITADAASHLDWLARENPGYLYTYPSLVRELARLSIERGLRLPGLREVRTLAESLGPDDRALVREAWGVPLTDLYSASEAGTLALQCPEYDHYHVQSENVLLEVLDDSGAPCAPGGIGRVVITPLHNFAMPLVRYDIGDYAEVGEPCPCGRGLPVLKRILGRVRNMLTTADGRRYWPVFGTRAIMDAAPVLQHQFVQKAYDLVEARLVVATPLSPAQESAFRDRVQSQLPPGVRLAIAYCERIERSASGKFEDFVSEVNAARQ
ncbi:MAG: phenylacetate--CoA ligase family protein [Gammaproteobacteria bacterium]